MLNHAAPPPDTWLNDPNALFHDGERYRLFAQHASDAPGFRRIGWGSFSSTNLLHWAWDGVAHEADESGFAYSGSVARLNGADAAFLTRHDPLARWQTQEIIQDGRRTRFGPEGRNCRDPFVFRWIPTGDWRALIARPCDWANWRGEGPSTLDVWCSVDGLRWERCGSIGPWHARGVMWEVPALIDFRDRQVLMLSLVDRRDGRADCSVRYWTGRFDGTRFTPDEEDGRRLDHGPDFYAAIPNLADGWPTAERVIVAWAGSWQTARAMPWPGFFGGPATLPRRIDLCRESGRLRQYPAVLPDSAERLTLRAGKQLTIGGSRLVLTPTPAALELTLLRPALPDLCAAMTVEPPHEVTIVRDGMLVEVFSGGETFTAACP